jgi:hypothetical protein
LPTMAPLNPSLVASKRGTSFSPSPERGRVGGGWGEGERERERESACERAKARDRERGRARAREGERGRERKHHVCMIKSLYAVYTEARMQTPPSPPPLCRHGSSNHKQVYMNIMGTMC